jgi:hypothetical protein
LFWKKNLHTSLHSGSIFFPKALPLIPAKSGAGNIKKPGKASAEGQGKMAKNITDMKTQQNKAPPQQGANDRKLKATPSNYQSFKKIIQFKITAS